MGARLLRTASTLCVLFLGVSSGCAGHKRTLRSIPRNSSPSVETRLLKFPLDEGKQATLGAQLFLPAGDAKVPAVLMVPGGGRVSFKGTRAGNGSRSYPNAVDVTTQFATRLATRGRLVLAWDKRTCGPRDTPSCHRNDTSDLDRLGPVALARDVDAACDLVQKEPRFNGQIILWAHSQGVAVALHSQCAKRARATVWVAPIPGPIDAVLIAGLKRRAALLKKWGQKNPDKLAGEAQIQQALKLQNQAGNFQDIFRTLDAGGFPEDGTVLGATPAFWKEWRAVTKNAPQDITLAKPPRLIVLGQLDSQYAPADKNRIADLGEGEHASFYVVKGGDHHLFQDRVLKPETIDMIIDALENLLAQGEEPAS